MYSRRLRLSLSGIMLSLGLFFASIPLINAEEEQEEKSLYHRLGGYDAIAAVTDDFIGRLVSDPQLGRFFIGHSNDSKKKMRQLIVDQLCAVTGGPCVYIGRDMKTVHEGLNITEADWDLSVQLLIASLNKFKVPQKEKDEFLNLASSLKGDIVTAPTGAEKTQ